MIFIKIKPGLCAYFERARAPFVLLQLDTIQAVCFPLGLILFSNNLSIAASNGMSFPFAYRLFLSAIFLSPKGLIISESLLILTVKLKAESH